MRNELKKIDFKVTSDFSPDIADAVQFIGCSDIPHVMRDVVDRYFKKSGVKVRPTHFLDNLSTGISLVASTRGITLLPAYFIPLLPRSVVSRPLKGKTPTIELAAGYRKDNKSPALKCLLEGIDQLVAAGRAMVSRKWPE